MKKGETIKPIEAEVVTGIPEAIYWSMVPKGVKRASAPSAPHSTSLVEEQADGQFQVKYDTNAEVIDAPGEQPVGVAAANSTGSKKRPVDEIADEKAEEAISAKQARLEGD